MAGLMFLARSPLAWLLSVALFHRREKHISGESFFLNLFLNMVFESEKRDKEFFTSCRFYNLCRIAARSIATCIEVHMFAAREGLLLKFFSNCKHVKVKVKAALM